MKGEDALKGNHCDADAVHGENSVGPMPSIIVLQATREQVLAGATCVHPLNLTRSSDMSVSPRRALIVIDVQNEYFTGNLQIEYPPSSQSLANIGRVMDAATASGVPVIVIQQHSPADAPAFAAGSDGWRLHEAVE